MLISPATAREHHQALGSNTTEDALIERLICRADALMAELCGFPIPDNGIPTMCATTYTVYPPAPRKSDPRALFLGMYPVVRVGAAYSSPEWDYADAELLADDEFVLDGPRGTLWLTKDAAHTWCDTPRANKVTFTGGFETVPPSLQALAAYAVAHLYRTRTGTTLTASSAAGQSVTFRERRSLLPPEVVNGLGPYRVWEGALG